MIPPPDTYRFFFLVQKEKKIMFGIIRSTEMMKQKTLVEGWLRARYLGSSQHLEGVAHQQRGEVC